MKTSDEEFDAKDYRTQIAFLFVDRVVDENGNVESCITEDDYSKAMVLASGEIDQSRAKTANSQPI